MSLQLNPPPENFSFSLSVEEDFEDLSPCKPVRASLNRRQVSMPKFDSIQFQNPFKSSKHEFSTNSDKSKHSFTIDEEEIQEDSETDCDSTSVDLDIDIEEPNSSCEIIDTPRRESSALHRPHKSVLGISFTTMQGQNSGHPAPALPFLPASKIRRTQSMFTTPQQLIHDQVAYMDAHTPDIAERSYFDHPHCMIPTFKVKQDPFRRIDSDTMCRLLDGEFSSIFEHIIVIDCRFEYEFEGGHIDGAINVNSKHQLENIMFQNVLNTSKLLVFHCEHSAYRSPMLANHLRRRDREINSMTYPDLYYPNVVVLHGGYNQFYSVASDRCVPRNYIEMNHAEHQRTCKREMSRFRDNVKARKCPSLSASIEQIPRLANFQFPAMRSASIGVPREHSDVFSF